jgi:tetratricopeptide (TPR) repeat protein
MDKQPILITLLAVILLPACEAAKNPASVEVLKTPTVASTEPLNDCYANPTRDCLTVEALNAAIKIVNPIRRAQALTRVADVHADAKMPLLAFDAVDLGFEAVQSTRSSNRNLRDWAKAKLIGVFVKTGNFDRARNELKDIKFIPARDWVLEKLSIAIVPKYGSTYAEFFRKEISVGHRRASVLVNVAEIWAESERKVSRGKSSARQRISSALAAIWETRDASASWRARHLGRLGAASLKIGDINRADFTYKQSLATTLQIPNYQKRGEVLTEIAGDLDRYGSVKLAQKVYSDAFIIAGDLRSTHARAKLLTKVAETQFKAGNEDQAFETSMKALEAAKKISNAFKRTGILAKIGQVQNKLGKAKQARETIRFALASANLEKKNGHRAHALASVANVQAKVVNVDRAKETITRAAQSAKDEQKDYFWRTLALSNIIGVLYKNMGLNS